MADTSGQTISDLLHEKRTFPPTADFKSQANIQDVEIYQKAAKDMEEYWAGWATKLEWIKPWSQILDWKPPHVRWFVDGKINASANCLDRHIRSSMKSKTAILWEGEPGDKRTLSYEELYKEVCRCSNVLKKLSVNKCDRVAIYMPMTPELIIACLACARIGAVHSVVFGGFSAQSLKDRINDAEAKLVITADFGYRRGKKIILKETVDEALQDCPSIQHSIVVARDGADTNMCQMKSGRDEWWHELMKGALDECQPEEMDAEDILFILYTSGTTGKPKGIVHTTGGYLTGVYATTQWIFDLKDKDVFWCTADVGWITGHSYIIYGPLSNGATILVYEGAPDWPNKDRFWKMVEDYRVSVFYTAPTAIRTFMKWGPEWPGKHDLSSLRLLGSVGEPINPEAWIWYHKNIGKENCPIVDTWWQTETGSILVTPLPGITTTKPGSAARPFPGISVAVMNEKGEEQKSGGGFLALTKPWPSMLRTIYKDDDQYKKQYWSKWKNDVYFAGDGAKLDADGDLWFLGRVDDVMNVSGHRISTMEVESALVDHTKVAESAVVSRSHEIKGEAIVAFVTLKEGVTESPELMSELKKHVDKKIGAIARPEDIHFTADLPKTRSGKIMRRLLKDIASGKALGDTTTLADASVIANLRDAYESQEGS